MRSRTCLRHIRSFIFSQLLPRQSGAGAARFPLCGSRRRKIPLRRDESFVNFRTPPPVWTRGPSTMFDFVSKSELSGFRFIPFNIICSKRVHRPESVYRLKRPAFLLSGPNDDDLKVCRSHRASCETRTWKFAGPTRKLNAAHGGLWNSRKL